MDTLNAKIPNAVCRPKRFSGSNYPPEHIAFDWLMTFAKALYMEEEDDGMSDSLMSREGLSLRCSKLWFLVASSSCLAFFLCFLKFPTPMSTFLVSWWSVQNAILEKRRKPQPQTNIIRLTSCRRRQLFCVVHRKSPKKLMISARRAIRDIEYFVLDWPCLEACLYARSLSWVRDGTRETSTNACSYLLL